ncbi:MAG TPA: lipid-binding SYLF domain-containing protein [Bryobacteraceae bacterium]|nr:lipid-binding SYLF domain-containing protein [Bryobacteraceae bacterium]
MNAIVKYSDRGIPQDLLSKAICVIVVPNLKRGEFIVGGENGRGVFACRKSSGVGWSAPGFIKISGGPTGLMIGGGEMDLVMLVMNKSGLRHLVSDKFAFGGEASAAAGPIGRSVSADTDAEMHAEFLVYSRSHGVFGGIDLDGAVITEDEQLNREMYGRGVSNKEILRGDVHLSPDAKSFVSTLDRLVSRK